jgi:hypothetical protein
VPHNRLSIAGNHSAGQVVWQAATGEPVMAETTNSDIESLRAEVARLSKIVSAQSAQA